MVSVVSVETFMRDFQAPWHAYSPPCRTSSYSKHALLAVHLTFLEPIHWSIWAWIHYIDADSLAKTSEIFERIRILHFLSMADKMPKKSFFAYYFLKVRYIYTSLPKMKSHKDVTK